MVTPALEKLILCGKAFFKTFVAGGTKHTLTFGNDRFIIITDITYFPMNVNTTDTVFGTVIQNHNTQVAIYGDRGYNHFIFRNYNDAKGNTLDFASPTTIHTYLLHEQQVGFSFSNAPTLNNLGIGIANTTNPGYKPPIENGIDGQPGAIPVILTADTSGPTPTQINFTTRPAGGNNESQQLFFPFTPSNSFVNGPLSDNYEFPLLHVNYIEVLGQAGNIQI